MKRGNIVRGVNARRESIPLHCGGDPLPGSETLAYFGASGDLKSINASIAIQHDSISARTAQRNTAVARHAQRDRI